MKADQYAKVGIPGYWRVEPSPLGGDGRPIGPPVVYTYLLDPARQVYRDGEVFTGVVKVRAPFPVEIDLGVL